VLVATFAAAAPTAVGAAAGPPVPQLHWVSCGAPYQCATAKVPLDYDQPNGATISLSLARLPATDRAHRIGSLFINPGGPGGPGAVLIRGGAAQVIFSDEVRARFDVVGFDPRGVAGSTPLQCFRSNAELAELLQGVPLFPFKQGELGPYAAAFAKYGQACLHHGGPILRHMSTANVARDLDLLRQAVGDAGLTYDGVSYGSFLGVTYANLFPGKVRALIVDGVLDPVAWTTGRPPSGSSVPFSTRLGSAHGADDAFHQFLKQCEAAGPRRCAFAPGAPQKFARLDARARTRPIVDSRGAHVPYDQFNGLLLNDMYDASGWSQLAADLEDFYEATFSGHAAPAAETSSHYAYDNGFDAFLGVACSDTLNPTDPFAWQRATQRQAQTAPLFAANWTYASEPCATWPVTDQDHYLGPFDRTTRNPVLVIGNLHDPATPYHGAQTVNRLLPGSRLLTLNGTGHTSWVQSGCIDARVTRYLVDGALPPVGTVCASDVHPFADDAPSAADARVRAQIVRPTWAPLALR
jgi:pimeloyl-ACP methyl ester carboxylesterase